MELELLSIVETLNEYKNILFGHEITVYTDHKNLVHETVLMLSERVMRWRLLLEEYGPTFIHIKSEKNIVADALSRLDTEEKQEEKIEQLFAIEAETPEVQFPVET